MIEPRSPEELADALASAAGPGRTIQLCGASTKNAMGGPVAPAETSVTTRAMKRVLQYEPSDLTISVEAGLPWAELTSLLAQNRQMVPLDPPFADEATVGGVIATNSSGPRRRLYGTARDVVIGMKFATLEGKLVQSGGMVVKNVAGLDMGKLMIGSFGTLAAIGVVNFKLAPMPEQIRTFVFSYSSLEDAMATRDRILQSVLQPAAIDLVNPAAASRLGLSGYCVVLQVGGTEALLNRYGRELAGAERIESDSMWTAIREFVPTFLREYPDGAVTRLSTTLSGVRDALKSAAGPAISRAGTGVTYVYHMDGAKAAVGAHKGAIEFAPERAKASMTLWPDPGSDFPIMQKIKALFDPGHLLNRGRLYGRI